MPPLHGMTYLSGGTLLYTKEGFVAMLVFHLCSDNMQSTFLYRRHQHIDRKALCRNQVNFTMGFDVSLWRATYSLEESLDSLGILKETLLLTTQLDFPNPKSGIFIW